MGTEIELPLPKGSGFVPPNMILDNTGRFSNLFIYWNYRDINGKKKKYIQKIANLP
ncbi:MAG: hypothetical protein KGD63_07790 [Candidatus Lokiarchaeota archaeon]|nr:hypothetical protein [Candidatus Lokiarchaeota archaeon]